MKNELNKVTSKILNSDSLNNWIENCRKQKKSIVFTNGCFDLIHKGHVDYLAKAKDFGDLLIIAINSDESVKRLGKSSSRPLQDQNSRAQIMASFQFVDAVVVFDEDTPYNLIQLIKPDVLVKGADYKPENIVGYDILQSYNGEVKTIEYLEGYSTTRIENKIKNN